MTPDVDTLDFEKGDGLLPAVVQHARTAEILMVGYMNADAFEETRATGRVTFWSRSKKRLWMKGETSGDTLSFVSAATDCDRDALLIQALPAGPVCHLGSRSCFGDAPGPAETFFARLETLVAQRQGADPQESYTAKLFSRGIKKIAQKVGEEGVEAAIAGVSEDEAALTGEAADLVYHLIVLLRARGLSLADVAAELARRHADAARPAQSAPDGTDDGG